MAERRPTKLSAEQLSLEGLNPHEIITLHSIMERTVDKYQLALTKDGGLWPVIFTELFLEFDLSPGDIERAASELSYFFQELRMMNIPFPLSAPPAFPLEKMIDAFTKGLLGSYNQDIPALIRRAEEKYLQTLKSLSAKGLLVDPFDWFSIVVLGLFPYRFNRETEHGRTKLINVKASFWEFEYSRDPNDPKRTSIKFNSALLEKFSSFIRRFVQKSVPPGAT